MDCKQMNSTIYDLKAEDAEIYIKITKYVLFHFTINESKLLNLIICKIYRIYRK